MPRSPRDSAKNAVLGRHFFQSHSENCGIISHNPLPLRSGKGVCNYHLSLTVFLTWLHESDIEDLLDLRVVRRHVEDDLLTLLPLVFQLRLPVSTAALGVVLCALRSLRMRGLRDGRDVDRHEVLGDLFSGCQKIIGARLYFFS